MTARPFGGTRQGRLGSRKTASSPYLAQAKEALRGFRGAIVLVVDEELAKTDLAQFED